MSNKELDTLENPGGHREAGEYIDDTLAKELKEKTGAIEKERGIFFDPCLQKNTTL